MPNILGLDIGGANIKACDLTGRACSVAFPLWKQPEQLATALVWLIERFEDVSTVAVTMTGELADCFADKAKGVRAIVTAVETAIGQRDGVVAGYWQTSGEFVDADTAREFPLLTAAANWHLLATWVGRVVPQGTALLLDMGSTTTDIIPIKTGLPEASGLTDVERLQAGELVYLGVRRTPLMALGETILLDEQSTGVAAELFATTDDVFLFLGDVAERLDDLETADGQPRTRPYAHQRLARMVCGDATLVDRKNTQSLCQQWQDRLRLRIAIGIEQVLRQRPIPETIVTSGEGEFFLSRVLDCHSTLSDISRMSLTKLLGSDISEVACAYAGVQIAAERPWQFG